MKGCSQVGPHRNDMASVSFESDNVDEAFFAAAEFLKKQRAINEAYVEGRPETAPNENPEWVGLFVRAVDVDANLCSMCVCNRDDEFGCFVLTLMIDG